MEGREGIIRGVEKTSTPTAPHTNLMKSNYHTPHNTVCLIVCSYPACTTHYTPHHHTALSINN
jgi:hypothetical protein